MTAAASALLSERSVHAFEPFSVAAAALADELLRFPKEIREQSAATRPVTATVGATITVNKETVTTFRLEHERAKDALKYLLESEDFQSFSYYTGRGPETNMLSRHFAIQLIARLADDKLLPKISPDGEGDIIMVWGEPPQFVLTIEQASLHGVVNPGSRRSKHIAPVEFDGREVPSEIIAQIPGH